MDMAEIFTVTAAVIDTTFDYCATVKKSRPKIYARPRHEIAL
jgi:hypothetical protein